MVTNNLFTIIYSYGKDLEFTMESKVYAIDPVGNQFLIVDDRNKFHWASIERCKLKVE